MGDQPFIILLKYSSGYISDSFHTQVPSLVSTYPNGSLVFSPFSAPRYTPALHAAPYACLVSTPLGALRSRPVTIRAGERAEAGGEEAGWCQGRGEQRPGGAEVGGSRSQVVQRPGGAEAGWCRGRREQRPSGAEAGGSRSQVVQRPGGAEAGWCRGRRKQRPSGAEAGGSRDSEEQILRSRGRGTEAWGGEGQEGKDRGADVGKKGPRWQKRGA